MIKAFIHLQFESMLLEKLPAFEMQFEVLPVQTDFIEFYGDGNLMQFEYREFMQNNEIHLIFMEKDNQYDYHKDMIKKIYWHQVADHFTKK